MTEPFWLTAFRDITNATNARTMVSSPLGSYGVGNKAPLYDVSPRITAAAGILLTNFNSTILDWTARFSVGGTNLNFFIVRQLPILRPEVFLEEAHSGQTYAEFIAPRMLELTYTAWDLAPFALDLGYSAPPFRWDDERRFHIRCELDAIFFHLYLGDESRWKQDGSKELSAYFPAPRDAVEYIMESFPIVKRKDEQVHGCYRTKDTILEIYDQMAEVIQANAAAVAAGQQPTVRYQTVLNPPPGPPTDAAGNFIPMAQWDRTNWPVHIHQPRKAATAVPEEVPVAEFAVMAYPATDADKALCAAALAVVEQSSDISSMEHLDALLLATHPDWCKAFLDDQTQTAFAAARKSAPAVLFVGQGLSIRWKDCRDHLERLGALTVAHGGQGQLLGPGKKLAAVKADFPHGADEVVKYALQALERIRELRKDLPTVPQPQQDILNFFAQQHQLYHLAA